LEKIINVDKHYEKTFRKAIKIKAGNQYGSVADYFHDLYDFFLGDIEETAKRIYEEVLDYHLLKSFKLTPRRPSAPELAL
jgi:hypothetical protein